MHRNGSSAVGNGRPPGRQSQPGSVSDWKLGSAAVDCHVAALPVPYRTNDAEPSFQSLTDPDCDCLPGDRPFPTALDPFLCNRYEIAEFTREAILSEVRYLGVCCGAGPHMIRSMAEALGRTPPASRYSPDMSRHAFLGSDPSLKTHNQAFRREL